LLNLFKYIWKLGINLSIGGELTFVHLPWRVGFSCQI